MENSLSSITTIPTWCKQYQITITSIIIFVMVFGILGLPFTSWWFYGADDSHALFLAYQTKTWKDLLYFFYDGHVLQGQIGPSNFIPSDKHTTFLTTYYRPLTLILYTVFYWTFGANGYAFHLINVGVHAFNTSLLFLLFRWIISTPWAFLGALLFATHPQIGLRFGAFVNLQYYLSTTGLLLITLLYQTRSKRMWYSIASMIYIAMLFLRESSIVLPFVGVIIILLHEQSTLKTAFVKISPFFMLMIAFLLLRLLLYPYHGPLETTCFSIKKVLPFILIKIREHLIFMYDIFHLSWLPWGNPIIRGAVLLGCSLTSGLLFLYNKKKLWIIALVISIYSMLWPTLLSPYSPRYFYEVHPLVLAMFALLFSYQKQPWTLVTKRLGFILLSFMVIAQFFYTIANFSRRNQKMNILRHGVIELIQRSEVQTSNRPLCILGHPFDGFATQNAQIFWVLLDDTKRTIYFDNATALISTHHNVFSSMPWGIISSCYPTNDNYTIINNGTDYLFTSENPNDLYFSTEHKDYSLGTRTVLRKEKTLHDNDVVTQFLLSLENVYYEKNPYVVAWSFAQGKFLPISYKN